VFRGGKSRPGALPNLISNCRQKMKILMVSDVFFPRINGVSTSIETFRRELEAMGDSVTLIAPRYGNEAPDDDIARVPSRRVVFDPEDRMMRYWATVQQARELRGAGYDLVHIHTPFVAHYAGLKVARTLALPCVATYHTFFEEYLFHYVPVLPKGWLRAAARSFSRRQCNDLDALIVPSTAMRDVLRDYGVRRPMRILPTGISRECFAPADGAAFRAKHGIDPRRPVALFVGRVAFEKNIDFLLRALDLARQRMRDLLLVIAGEGPALDSLRAAVKRGGLEANVLFVGYLDRVTELPACYSAADVFAFASLTETQGLVLLEAMALGVPVVAIPAMGTRDILAAGRGTIAASTNQREFADQLVSVLSDSDARRELAQQARRHAAEWDARTMALELREFYAETVETARSRTAVGAEMVGGI
jgi:1,2-diacylglycerol 3-alpha-glucosyltransferase